MEVSITSKLKINGRILFDYVDLQCLKCRMTIDYRDTRYNQIGKNKCEGEWRSEERTSHQYRQYNTPP
jgi:hypothetical protein